MSIIPVKIRSAGKLPVKMPVYVQKSRLALPNHHLLIKPGRNQMTIHSGHLILRHLNAGDIHQTNLIFLKHIPVEGFPIHQNLLENTVRHMNTNTMIGNTHPNHALCKLRLTHQKLRRKLLGIHLSHHRYNPKLISKKRINRVLSGKQQALQNPILQQISTFLFLNQILHLYLLFQFRNIPHNTPV